MLEIKYSRTSPNPARMAARARFVDPASELTAKWASCDPGDHGSLIVYSQNPSGGADIPREVWFGKDMYEIKTRVDIDTLVIEHPYRDEKKSVASLMDFCVNVGRVIGLIRPETLVWIPPVSWQSQMLGSKMQRASLKAMSIERAKTDLKRLGPDSWAKLPDVKWKQEAFSDAFNIGTFFQGLEKQHACTHNGNSIGTGRLERGYKGSGTARDRNALRKRSQLQSMHGTGATLPAGQTTDLHLR